MRLSTLLLGMCMAAALPALGQYLETLPPSPDVITIQSWRVHPGDNLAWATPDFDDEAWASVPLPQRAAASTI
jgi:hypothetical protein